MTDTHLENQVVSLAPGEDKIPENILYSQDWDLRSYPTLNNPDGKNGLKDPERKVSITDQQYSQTRLLHVDKRFARSPNYLFTAVQHQELKQIRRNQNLSYTTGRQTVQPDGKITLEQSDAYKVLDDIPNSPKFWRTKKFEALAKLDNYGPFHWFFTLSQADKRWSNIYTTILRELPDVIFISHSNTKKDGFVQEEIKIDSKEHGLIPLEDYLKRMPASQHELIKDNVLAMTRVFDQRLKAFIKNIMMGKDNPMKVLLYSYR